MVPAIVLSFQGQSAPIPPLDYSRTALGQNEEVVIPRELFVRRKPLPGVCSSSVSLPILPGRRKTGKERADFLRPSSLDSVAAFPLACRTNVVSLS
jgi:hypothetical protein